MPKLSVCVDHVATVRQARRAAVPDPVQAAMLAELGGAGGITVHLRRDRRHIQDRDVEILRQVVKTRLTVKMAATQEMARIGLTVMPNQVTLVPERPEEVTTETGLDVILNSMQLKPLVRTLQDGRVSVGLFIDPDLDQVKESHKLGCQVVEVNTASFADAVDEGSMETAHRRIVDAARLGKKLGLRVHAGHGLHYGNVGRIAAIPELSELGIGHSIVARAVLVGTERAVREMVEAIG